MNVHSLKYPETAEHFYFKASILFHYQILQNINTLGWSPQLIKAEYNCIRLSVLAFRSGRICSLPRFAVGNIFAYGVSTSA